MKSFISSLVAVLVFSWTTQAFYVSSTARRAALTPCSMMPLVDAPMVEQQMQNLPPASSSVTSPMQQGVQNYASTMNVALQERKPITAEEIAAKKRNFNVIFWVRPTCVSSSRRSFKKRMLVLAWQLLCLFDSFE